MSAAPNRRPFDAGRAAYLALNALLLAFLLLPIAIVLVFALNPTPYISFPPVGVSLRWFEKFFGSAEFMNALWLSLCCMVVTGFPLQSCNVIIHQLARQVSVVFIWILHGVVP